MDNPLTPKKIQRLIHYAEDRSFSRERRVLLSEEEVHQIAAQVAQAPLSKSYAKYESSSGILDLEHVEGFGESGIGNVSLSKSSAFNPGEMTGRSTGAEDVTSGSTSLLPPPSDSYRRHSLALESVTNTMDRQTEEVNNIMRHSFRDLTADEVSLIHREGPLPVQNTYSLFTEGTSSLNTSDLSMGTYFKNRCPKFGTILPKTESPDKSNMPSITEVSVSSSTKKDSNQVVTMDDDSLDCVPVRQPRPNIVPNKSTINNPSTAKLDKQKQFIKPDSSRTTEKQAVAFGSKVSEKTSHVKAVNPGSSAFPAPKSFMSSSKPADVLLKNLHSSFRLVNEDPEPEDSLSISKIADFLAKQSNVSVSEIMHLNQKKPSHKKQPLAELHLNNQEMIKKEVPEPVTDLKDTKKSDTTSTMETVLCSFHEPIPINNLRIQENVEDPKVMIALPYYDTPRAATDNTSRVSRSRSKSPSSKSQSTLSTVREKESFKSGDSPMNSSKDEVNRSKVPSITVCEYKELDKSVDWQEVLRQKRLRQESLATENSSASGLAKDQWAEIAATAADGFVGVSCAVTIKVTTLTDSWLTARLQFDYLPGDGKELNIELPRLPLLLSPGKSEQFTVHITSHVPMNTALPYTVFLKDTSIDGEIEQKGQLEVNLKLPVIQAMSADGMNVLSFPPTRENSSSIKSFVLISDCPVDLQLELSIAKGDSVFSINNVQEIRKPDVNKVLVESQGTTESHTAGKTKSKAMSKQLCRLSCGNAIRVTITFNAPKLSDLQTTETNVTLNGVLNVNLIGVNTVLRKVELVGAAGTANLDLSVPGDRLHISKGTSNVKVANSGSVSSIWVVKFACSDTDSVPFKVSSRRVELQPGAAATLDITYSGPEDYVTEACLIFEDTATGKQTTLMITGGSDVPKSFPIKTSHAHLTWVRAGRKELSLKNTTDRKIHIRCFIAGDGFSIDMPGVESRGIYCFQFNPNERRSLPIIFAPSSAMPFAACLNLRLDKNSVLSRKVKLHGCASGDAMRWSGLVTYSDTALVRAASRAPIDLKLHNKSAMPAFVAASVHFNLQLRSAEETSRLVGGARVVQGRAAHTLSLHVDWRRVERRAGDSATTALATVTVLTGAEFTRRRILKIIRQESGDLDTSLLPGHLRVLAERFEGEDEAMDVFFNDFEETSASLNDLIGGLQELTAHIDLPQDFGDENTIIISDDTVLEHHTLCE